MRLKGILFAILVLAAVADSEELCDYFYNQTDDCISPLSETAGGSIFSPLFEAILEIIVPPEEDYHVVASPCVFAMSEFDCEDSACCESHCTSACSGYEESFTQYDEYQCVCHCGSPSGCLDCSSSNIVECYEVNTAEDCQNSVWTDGSDYFPCFWSDDFGSQSCTTFTSNNWATSEACTSPPCFLAGTKILMA